MLRLAIGQLLQFQSLLIQRADSIAKSKIIKFLLMLNYFKICLFKVRTLSETVRLDARTKLLNPKWYEGMMSTGYEGVREIEKRLTNTVGWSATSGQVDNWVYEEANSTFIQDEEMLNKLMSTNPNSFRKMLQTFLEANGRGYWETSQDNIEKLRQLYSEVEDKIEGIDR